MSITSKRIGIIGQGYVGTAIKLGFEKDFNVNTFDKYFNFEKIEFLNEKAGI